MSKHFQIPVGTLILILVFMVARECTRNKPAAVDPANIPGLVAKNSTTRQTQQMLRRQYADEIRQVLSNEYVLYSELEQGRTWGEHLFGYSQESVDNYVRQLRGIDFSRCPHDFRKAFGIYIGNWVELANIYGRTGWLELDSPEIRNANVNIEASAAACLDVADSYGVDTVPYRIE